MAVAPGLVTIFCRACIDNPRAVNVNSNFGLVDALFFSSRMIDYTSTVYSSLRFDKRPTFLHEGVYDITANARFPLFHIYKRNSNLSCRSLRIASLTTSKTRPSITGAAN